MQKSAALRQKTRAGGHREEAPGITQPLIMIGSGQRKKKKRGNIVYVPLLRVGGRTDSPPERSTAPGKRGGGKIDVTPLPVGEARIKGRGQALDGTLAEGRKDYWTILCNGEGKKRATPARLVQGEEKRYSSTSRR